MTLKVPTEPAEPSTLRCPRCREEKPLTDFSPAPSRPRGVGSHCRPCKRDIIREYRSTEQGREASRQAAARYRARRRALRDAGAL